MKRINLFLLLTAFAVTTFAQKVALHTNGNVHIFNGTDPLVSAYNASQPGDTIYLPGGSFNPPANFEKQLTILGAGHYPDSTQATGKTFINGSVQLRENADNFHIEGVEITGSVILYNNESVNGVIIKRCKINGLFNVLGNLTNPSSNLSCIGNVIVGRINFENAQNVLLSNNIIQNTFQSSNGNLITNNIVLGFVYGSSMDYLFYGNNNTLNNNIFIWNGYNADVNGQGNVYNNNLYVAATPNFGTNSIASGNYVGMLQANIFVNQTGTAFNYAHDYHLQSPATYLGTDGTQIGIYGGAFPYKEGAVPSNPHIESAVVTPVTDGDGKLNVQIKVRAEQ
jgi:hypothetical protein